MKDYLSDYGNEKTVDRIRDNVLSCEEKEFFVSFSLPVTTSGEDMLKFIRVLQKNYFYY